ncbi:MAG: GNAT family N-acetyltransferase [Actinomycetota bacterium]
MNNEIVLKTFTEDDKHQHEQMSNYKHIKKNLSHFYPKKYKNNVSRNSYTFYTINLNDEMIGSIWIELDENEPDSTYLGVMIGPEKYLGKGIGTIAIKKAIEKSQNKLNFNKVKLNVRKSNERAISCYTKIGFKIISEWNRIDESGKEYKCLAMEYKL